MDKDLKIYLKGYSQIMLQESAITGLLFLAGISWASPTMGLTSLLAVITATLVARLFKFGSDNVKGIHNLKARVSVNDKLNTRNSVNDKLNTSNTRNTRNTRNTTNTTSNNTADSHNLDIGLYGFSAVLVGVAVPLFLYSSIVTWILVVVGAAAAAILQNWAIKRSFPAFTFPFVVVTWLIIVGVGALAPQLLKVNLGVTVVANQSISDLLYITPIRGFGQVIFQDNLLAGALFIAGMLFVNQIATLYGLAAALFGALVAMLFGAPMEGIMLGLWSFNAVLCAILFAEKSVAGLLWVTVAVSISLVISFLFNYIPIPQLTFPFVAASWITLLIKKWVAKR